MNESDSDKRTASLVFPKLLSFAILLIVIGFNIFEFGSPSLDGVGFGLFNLVVLGSLLVTLKGEKRNVYTYTLAVIGGLAGLLVAYRANGFVIVLNLAISQIINLTLLTIKCFDGINLQVWWLFKSLGLLFLSYITHPFRMLQDSSKENIDQNKTVSLIKTALISVVLIGFFALLLSSADPVFSRILNNIKSQTVGRVISSLILASISLLALTLKIEKRDGNAPTISFLNFTEFSIPVFGLVLLFASFLVIQANYLFASHEVFRTFDITYSDYVRKGFFELILASFLGGVVAYIGILRTQSLENISHSLKLKVINAVLISELILMVASAQKRNMMYIEIYGLTRTRIIGEAFLFLIVSGLFLLFAFTLVKHFKEKYLVLGVATASLLVFLFFNLVNTDQMIVNGSPSRDGYKDWFYINNLSEDAVEGWYQSVTASAKTFDDEFANKQILTDVERRKLANIELALYSLRYKRDEIVRMHEVPAAWQTYNFSRKQAYLQIKAREDIYYTLLDELIDRISRFKSTRNIDLYDSETWILYDFDYPFLDTSKIRNNRPVNGYRLLPNLND